jgi:hypothetical protein
MPWLFEPRGENQEASSENTKDCEELVREREP